MKKKIFVSFFILFALFIMIFALLIRDRAFNVYQVFIGSAISIIIFGIVSFFLLSKIFNDLSESILHLTSAANEIWGQNYSERLNITAVDEFGELFEAFNNMAYKIEMNISALNNKNIEIQSVINSISNGILAIDRNHKIVLINPFACDIFQIDNSYNPIGDNIMGYVRNSSINQLLKKTIENNVSFEEEIPFAGDRILRINTSPIKATNNSYSNGGGIVFIQDITKLKKFEQIRTEFVSNVTHELKTPLTSIRGFIETIKYGGINEQKRIMRFLDIIDIEAERLYLLISDILQLSEIEFKKADVEIDFVNLREIVDEVFEISQNVAKEKEVTLSNNIDEDLVVYANKNRMKQLLLNLVNNAVKYNYQGGIVIVSGHIESGKVVIGVKDSGIGIAEEHSARIFERFYRVDKGRSRDMGGTGLGLSIVKHIVQLYNGDIKFISEEGKGSEFIIQLPHTNLR